MTEAHLEPTQNYALLGWPVKHSVSPQMQGAAFRALGIAAVYRLIEVVPEDVPEMVAQLRDQQYAGWNVTVPHKAQMAELVDEISPGALAAGTVNTVVNRAGHLSGHSTDGYGLASAIAESFDVRVAGGKFVFVGAGGAARATSVYFAQEGAAELVLVNRTLSKAERLAETIRRTNGACRVVCLGLTDADAIHAAAAGADVVFQATSLGLHVGDPMPVPATVFTPDMCVMDMIYRRTALLEAASARGCRTADGRGMLLHQGVRSFELWTGRTAPVDVMRQALNDVLACRGNPG